jgi:glycosyltransferase involved in cell wall biosynthesis
MRYIWNLYDEYFGPGRAGPATRIAMRAIVGSLRRWDLRTAGTPTTFIANSENIRKRIADIYHRDAVVIYPPVDVASVRCSERDEGFFLMVTAMVPYKRVDLAIKACNRMKTRLVIVGTGPESVGLKRIAGPTIEFRGWASDAEVKELYATCTALLFPGEEDFGMVPVEAMAHGKPVIAYGKGGALETVREGPEPLTGVLFLEQHVESMIEAMQRFKRISFEGSVIRQSALRFDRSEFKSAFRNVVPSGFLQP